MELNNRGTADESTIPKTDSEKVELYRMKKVLVNKAFELKNNHTDITQDEATNLNNLHEALINQLAEYGYNPLNDYIIDFNSFVKDNEEYRKHRF